MSSSLVVKRTFIELGSDQPLCRPRAQSDTILDYGFSASVALPEDSTVMKADCLSVCETSMGESWADASESDSEALSAVVVSSNVAEEASAGSDACSQLKCDEVVCSHSGRNFIVDTSMEQSMFYMMVSMPPVEASWYSGPSSGDSAPNSGIGKKKKSRTAKKAAGRVDKVITKSQCAGASTVVVLRQLPRSSSQEQLLKLLDERFAGLYDFIYLPADFKTSQALGYAIVDFISGEIAEAAIAAFDGADFESRTIAAERSKSHSGLESLLQRYQNSPVMEEEVPDQYKPLLFSNGQRVPFL